MVREEKPNVQKIISNMQVADPVTQAVIDNVAGKLPVKKQPVRCEVCNLSLSGPTVYDSHILGAKHKKKLASLGQAQPAAVSTTIATISSPVEVKVAPGSNVVRCTVCDIWVNTEGQLKLHEEGKQHKKKLNSPNAGTATAAGATSNGKATGPETPLPEYVEKKVENGITIFTCTLCSKMSNSRGQLDVHLGARTHANKIKGVFGTRHAPYDKKKTLARATFSSFRSGGVLGQERSTRPVLDFPKGPVSYPNYNANLPSPSQFGFSESPQGYPKKLPTSYNTTGYDYSKQTNVKPQNQFKRNYNKPQYNANGQSNQSYGQSNFVGSFANAYGAGYETAATPRYKTSYGSDLYGQTPGNSYGQTTGNSYSTSQYGNDSYGNNSYDNNSYGNGQNRGGKASLFANKAQSYNHDRITPSRAKHYFNTSINQSQPVFQTQGFQYM